MEQDMNMGGQMEQAPVEKKSMGITISIIIIVLIIALGAFYFMKKVPSGDEAEVLTPAEIQADQTISQLSTQGTSTAIPDIEQDLNATDFSDLDVGLDNISL